MVVLIIMKLFIPSAYFQNGRRINIISIDYEKLALENCYTQAVENTNVVARCTALFLEDLLKIRKDLRLSQIHVIGFSLGAHLAGKIANYFTGGTFERITGK